MATVAVEVAAEAVTVGTVAVAAKVAIVVAAETIVRPAEIVAAGVATEIRVERISDTRKKRRVRRRTAGGEAHFRSH